MPQIQFLLLTVLLFSCGSNQAGRGHSRFFEQGDWGLAIVQLRELESQNPDDARIKRDLGISYYKSGQIGEAIRKLEQSERLASGDPRTLLFLGLGHETAGALQEAAVAYRRCLALNLNENVSLELPVRIAELETQAFDDEVRSRLSESGNAGSAPQANSLAVLQFRNLSNWLELEPVLLGLAELIARDLSKVNVLAVAPQKKLDVLLDVMNFDISQLYDKTRISETGRLLGTRQVISGGIERTGQATISLTAAVVDARTGKLNGDGARASGRLSELLTLQKNLVFDLLADLQVTLNSREREAVNSPATTSMMAFIAFCKGVHFLNAKQFASSREQFEISLKHDPGFELARQHLATIPLKRLSVGELERLAW